MTQNQTNESHRNPPCPPERDEDDFYVDESIARLLGILLPRMKLIVAVSVLAAAVVGMKLFFFTPRAYVASATIAPDVMPDLTSLDIIQMKSGEGQEIRLPFDSQIAQIRTLANSSQVKRAIIDKVGLMDKWECAELRDCLKKLNSVYSVKDIRQVGLEIEAETIEPDLSLQIVNTAIEETNKYLKDLMETRAERAVQQIQDWINDVTQTIEAVSSESIRFASQNNITSLEAQYQAGTSLLGSIKQDIVQAETELTKQKQGLGDRHPDLIPLQVALKESRETLQELLYGGDSDQLYPPLSEYEPLRIRMEDYRQRLSLLRSRLELFNKQLAAARIESQKQSQSVMVLDEPAVEPAARGTVKFSILTFMAVFFIACVWVVMREYWRSLRKLIYAPAS